MQELPQESIDELARVTELLRTQRTLPPHNSRPSSPSTKVRRGRDRRSTAAHHFRRPLNVTVQPAP